MRSFLIAVLLGFFAACGGGGNNDAPDMQLCATKPCTCTQGTTCVRIAEHAPFCADDCTDDRDCVTGDHCVALYKGTGFLAKQCVRADRFVICSTATNCDLTSQPRCEGSTRITTLHVTDAACGYESVFCPNGCSNGACQ